MTVIKEILEKLAELLDRLVEALLGEKEPEAELIPIPVKQRSSGNYPRSH